MEKVGEFSEFTLYGSIDTEDRSAFLARVRPACDGRLTQPLAIREAVFRPRDFKTWTTTEVAAWLQQRVGSDLQKLNDGHLSGTQLVNLRRDELVRRGLSDQSVESVLKGISELLEQSKGLSLSDVRVRTDELAGLTAVQWSRRPNQSSDKVSVMSVSRLQVLGGSTASFLDSLGFSFAFDSVRVGESLWTRSGVCVSVYDIRKRSVQSGAPSSSSSSSSAMLQQIGVLSDAQPHVQEAMAQALRGTESLDPSHLVVELRITAKSEATEQAAEMLVTFAQTLAPLKFHSFH